MARPKIVIIGAGFAGLTVAKGLKNADCDVTIIDKTNHHLFQPLLYQVATSALSPAEIGAPIREILRESLNTTVLMGEATSVNTEESYVLLGTSDKIPFDSLVIAVGARHSYFGNDQWEKYAPGLKTIRDALTIREKILISFEKAERNAPTQNISKYLNFVVIGAGPTGVEMAGAIAEVCNNTLKKEFRRINPEKAKIFLLEATDYVLPTYPQKLSLKARQDLEDLGVTVITGKKVTGITDAGVQLEETFIESINIIWAAGNQAPALLATLKAPLDRAQRVIVENDLSVPGHPQIFVIGDSAHCDGKDGKPLPGVAPTAIQQGHYLAKILRKEIPKNKRKPFSYFDKGSMATIGKFKAIAMFKKLYCTGFIAWSAWCFIHILYLIGFRNRFIVLLKWIALSIAGLRSVRLINKNLDEQVSKTKQ